MEMFTHCEVCNQPTEIEVGFYYGTAYVSYAMSVALSVATLVIWWLTVGLSINDNRWVYWLVANSVVLIIMQPWLMRLSRSFWISWFVGYDPNWRNNDPRDVSERMNAEQGGNW